MSPELKDILEKLFQSEDSEGCSDDLTVVSKQLVEELKAWYKSQNEQFVSVSF